MPQRHRLIPEQIADYLRRWGTREPDPCAALRAETAADSRAHYELGPEEAQLLTLLVELTDASLIVEVGTFRGYGALALALAAGVNGHVITLDIDPEVQAAGRRHWEPAGVDARIDARTGPAADLLAALVDDPDYRGRVDLVVIDADKEGYPAYYEMALTLLRPGGVAVLDNMLWRGRVADADDHRERTVALRNLNAAIHGDARVTPVMLPIGDGVTVVRKRPG